MKLPLRLAALYDLWVRYRSVLRHAWSLRKTHDAARRRHDEAEFLPAALSLQESPPSPLPRVAARLIMLFFVIAIAWACFGHIDIVATASGRIIPSDRSKTIQPLEAATIKAIHVTDGQSVKAGQLLLELDATGAQADQSRIASDLTSARLAAARAGAMLQALDGHRALIKPVEGIDSAAIDAEQRWLDSQIAEYRSKLATLQADVAAREGELQASRELVAKIEQTLPLARQKAEDYKRLVAESFVSNHGYLEREQARLEQEGELKVQRGKVREYSGALAQAQAQAATLVAETRRTAMDAQMQAGQKMQELGQELIKARQRTRLMQIHAPVDGVVQQLAVHTIGGVVTPAQGLMVIVPQDNVLEVEAFLENKDIGFVDAGQNASIKIDAFPYTKYGILHGTVASISSDAINDEKRGLIYAVRVKLERGALQVDNKTIPLSPGMTTVAEIKTGERRVIEYFLSPLLTHASESIRER